MNTHCAISRSSLKGEGCTLVIKFVINIYNRVVNCTIIIKCQQENNILLLVYDKNTSLMTLMHFQDILSPSSKKALKQKKN